MTKAELTERIIDSLIDPWTDDPEDYLDATPIDVEYAKVMLRDIRENEEAAELEPDECLPAYVAPEMIMETYNCLICARQHEARVARLADWITENEPVCEYCNYYLPEHEDAKDVMPIDFLRDTDGFPFIEDASPLELLCIGMNSRQTFDPQDEYCWFDSDTMTMHSTDDPFGDGVLDAEDFAKFILLDAECFGYMFDHIIDDDDIPYILGCTKEEYINEQF
jgi:hypothetical protein